MSSVPVGDRDAPLFLDDSAWEAAQHLLMELVLTDGLPVVVPTHARLDAMLAGRDPAQSVGMMPPLFGEITMQAVAWCCVVAGCRPAEFSVVLASALAALEPSFNLLGIQTTTGTANVAVLVHQPLAQALGMNSGTNCLGPGNRANACVGRALGLVLRNIGGARPLVGDMATMGQPAKYGMAFAAGTHAFATPLRAPRRSSDEMGMVTVIGLSGTMEVLPEPGASTPEAVLRPVLSAMRGARAASCGGQRRDPGEQFLLLPPELADIFVAHGWRLADAQAFLQHAPGDDWPIARGPADIHIIVTGGPGSKMTCLVPWGGGTFCSTR